MLLTERYQTVFHCSCNSDNKGSILFYLVQLWVLRLENSVNFLWISISLAVCWSLSYQLFISMSVSDTVTLSTLVILAWMFFKHLFLTELYSHVNTLKSFKSSSFLFGPQTKLSLTFTVSLLVSCLRGAASVLPYRHQFTAFASSPGGKCVRRSEKWGRGSMQMYADVCRCVQIPKHCWFGMILIY